MSNSKAWHHRPVQPSAIHQRNIRAEHLPNQSPQTQLTVYFDGACPLCRKEISYYQRKDNERQVCWIDVSNCDQSLLGTDLSKQDALKRFHVRSADGALLSGASAFAEMWRMIPGFRGLGTIAQNKVLSRLLEALYWAFLGLRPTLQQIFRRFNK